MSTCKDYILNEKPVTVTLKENEIKEVIVQNKHTQGKIKVVKVDQDDNKIKLAGVKFNVYDENNKLVQSLTTDKNRNSNNKGTASKQKIYIKRNVNV